MNLIVVPPAIVIDTSLALHQLESYHAETLYQLIEHNRNHLLPWFDWVLTTVDSDDTIRFVQQAKEDAEQNLGFHYGIWLDERLVGVVGAHLWERENCFAELYYWLDAGLCGRGIITVCCQAVVDWLFLSTETGLIQICCEPQNQSSTRVAERLGFTRVGQEDLVSCSSDIIEYVFKNQADTPAGHRLAQYLGAKGYDHAKKEPLRIVLDLYQLTHEAWCRTRDRPPSPD